MIGSTKYAKCRRWRDGQKLQKITLRNISIKILVNKKLDISEKNSRTETKKCILKG